MQNNIRIANKDVYTKSELSEILRAMREQYVSDLRNMRNPDEICTAIVKAKIVTIGQIMDELGIEEE